MPAVARGLYVVASAKLEHVFTASNDANLGGQFRSDVGWAGWYYLMVMWLAKEGGSGSLDRFMLGH